MKATFSIEPKYLKAVNLMAGTDEMRYVLCGIAVEFRGTNEIILTATDGRRLLSLDVTQKACDVSFDAPGTVILPSELIAALPPLIRKIKTLTVTIKGDNVSITGRYTISGRLVIAEYPNWRNVIPKGAPAKVDSFALNIDLLSSFWKAAAMLDHAPVLKWFTFGENAPVMIHNDREPKWIGVMMPMRTIRDTFEIPTHAR